MAGTVTGVGLNSSPGNLGGANTTRKNSIINASLRNLEIKQAIENSNSNLANNNNNILKSCENVVKFEEKEAEGIAEEVVKHDENMQTSKVLNKELLEAVE